MKTKTQQRHEQQKNQQAVETLGRLHASAGGLPFCVEVTRYGRPEESPAEQGAVACGLAWRIIIEQRGVTPGDAYSSVRRQDFASCLWRESRFVFRVFDTAAAWWLADPKLRPQFNRAALAMIDTPGVFWQGQSVVVEDPELVRLLGGRFSKAEFESVRSGGMEFARVKSLTFVSGNLTPRLDD